MTTQLELWTRELGLHLWQSTAFALLITLLLTCLPGPAWLRHLAGLVGLLRFVLPAGALILALGAAQWPPLPALFASSQLQDFILPPFIVRGDGSTAPAAVFGLPLLPLLSCAWATGTLLLTSLWMLRLLRGHRALRNQTKPFSQAEAEHLRTLAQLAGVNPDKVSGHTTDSCAWLGVVGLFRSRIIVPDGLFSRMDRLEVEAVLLHELMHVRRRDNLLRLSQAGVVALFWFHPLVWWLHRRLIWDSERACDEAVLQLTNARQAYASGLCKAVHHALEITLPGVSGMSRMGLQARIHAVLNYKIRTASPVKNSLVLSSLVALLGLTTLFANPSPSTASATNPGTSTPEQEHSVFDITQVSQAPIVISQAAPRYPGELKKQKIQGKVLTSFVVDTDGNVITPQILKSSDSRFDASTLEAISQWKFKAGSKDGVPVRVRMAVPMVYSLKQE